MILNLVQLLYLLITCKNTKEPYDNLWNTRSVDGKSIIDIFRWN